MKQPNDNDKVWGEAYSHIKMPGNSPASQKTDIKTTASSGLVTLLIRLARNSVFIAFVHSLNCLIYGWAMSNWAIRHVWGGIVALLQICFSIREAILRKMKDFLWNHFIKLRPPSPFYEVPVYFFPSIFLAKKRDDFEGCLKGVDGCFKGVWRVFGKIK